MDKFLYRSYFTRNSCMRCLGLCLATKFRKIRMKQIANRLKKMVEIENKRTPVKPVDIFMVIISILGVFGGFA